METECVGYLQNYLQSNGVNPFVETILVSTLRDRVDAADYCGAGTRNLPVTPLTVSFAST